MRPYKYLLVNTEHNAFALRKSHLGRRNTMGANQRLENEFNTFKKTQACSKPKMHELPVNHYALSGTKKHKKLRMRKSEWLDTC
jgi:hypothetical protein